MNMAKIIRSHELLETSHANIQKLIDRNGDWQFYKILDENRYVPAVNYVLTLGYAKGPRFAEYLLSVTKEEAKKKLTTAGEEGSRTHQAIRMLILGEEIKLETKFMNSLTGRSEELTKDEWDNLIAWVAWCDKYNPETIMQETVTFSRKHGYAGTLDWFGVITVPEGDKAFPKEIAGKKVLILIDWKTSSGVWDEYKAQTAAYMEAVVEMGAHSQYFAHYGDLTYTGVVRLGTAHKNGGFELKAWNKGQTAEHLARFLAAKTIAAENLEFGIEVTEIPASFKRILPKATLPKKAAKKRITKPKKKV